MAYVKNKAARINALHKGKGVRHPGSNRTLVLRKLLRYKKIFCRPFVLDASAPIQTLRSDIVPGFW
jgi:hypothetical protein